MITPLCYVANSFEGLTTTFRVRNCRFRSSTVDGNRCVVDRAGTGRPVSRRILRSGSQHLATASALTAAAAAVSGAGAAAVASTHGKHHPFEPVSGPFSTVGIVGSC